MLSFRNLGSFVGAYNQMCRTRLERHLEPLWLVWLSILLQKSLNKMMIRFLRNFCLDGCHRLSLHTKPSSDGETRRGKILRNSELQRVIGTSLPRTGMYEEVCARKDYKGCRILQL